MWFQKYNSSILRFLQHPNFPLAGLPLPYYCQQIKQYGAVCGGKEGGSLFCTGEANTLTLSLYIRVLYKKKLRARVLNLSGYCFRQEVKGSVSQSLSKLFNKNS